MLQKIDKKKYIFFYLIILIILSSIHNSNFKHNNFFIVKKIEVVGLDKTDNLRFEKKLKDLIGSNILTINKESFKFIKSESLINKYSIKKIFPNHIKVYIESAVAISVIKYLNELIILGNNGKIIELENLPTKVPEITGTNNIKKIYQTIEMINNEDQFFYIALVGQKLHIDCFGSKDSNSGYQKNYLMPDTFGNNLNLIILSKFIL